jgi:hypothetical protein
MVKYSELGNVKLSHGATLVPQPFWPEWLRATILNVNLTFPNLFWPEWLRATILNVNLTFPNLF